MYRGRNVPNGNIEGDFVFRDGWWFDLTLLEEMWAAGNDKGKGKGKGKGKNGGDAWNGGRGVVVTTTTPPSPKLEMVLLPMPKPPPVPKPSLAPPGVGVIILAEGAKVGALQGATLAMA